MIVLEPTLIFVSKYFDGALKTMNITYKQKRVVHKSCDNVQITKKGEGVKMSK